MNPLVTAAGGAGDLGEMDVVGDDQSGDHLDVEPVVSEISKAYNNRRTCFGTSGSDTV